MADRTQHYSARNHHEEIPVESAADTILIESTFAIRDMKSGELEEFTLAHPGGENILENRISSITPAGRALYGRRVGDLVSIAAPGGTVHVRVESVVGSANVESDLLMETVSNVG